MNLHSTKLRRLAGAAVIVLAMTATTACQSLQAYDLPLPGKPVKKSDGYTVTAEFADVVDVVPRTLVMANDVPVGQVEEITRKGWNAEVVMTIRDDIVLPANAVADVQQTSLLGEKYISLTPPTGSTVETVGRLKDGAHIPLDRTARNAEVEEVLGALSFLLSRGGVGQLKTISTELNTMMEGRQESMRNVLEQLRTLVASLNANRGSIIEAMEAVDKLTATVNSETKAVEDAIDSFGPALEVLHSQHKDLMTMLKALDKLSVVATRVINNSGAGLVEALKHLKPTLTKLADAGDSLPRGLMMAASFPWPKQSEDLARGEYSNALFHMDLDLEQLINGASTGGNTGLPQALQLCSTYAQGCDAIQPIVDALCQITNVNFACSMVGKANAPAKVAKGQKGSTTKGGAPAGSGAAVTNPLNDLLGQILGGNGGLGGTLGLSGKAPRKAARQRARQSGATR